MAQFVCTDSRLDSARKRQMSLPGCFGGFGLRLNASGLLADAAYFAAWSALSPQVSRYCQTLGLLSSTCAGEMQALQARDLLRIAGISANDAGMVEFSADAKVAYDMSPWGPDIPSSAVGRRSIEPMPTAPFPPLGSTPAKAHMKLASRLFKHVEAPEAMSLWNDSGNHHRIVLLSGGGPGAGSAWSQLPARQADNFSSAHFRAAASRRLAVISAPPGTTCCIPCSADAGADPCGEALDAELTHALVCKQGVARMRPHRNLAGIPAKLLKSSRAEVDLERAVPLLRTSRNGELMEDAILDVVATWPGGCVQA
jgi:hypothetical protein